MPLARCEQELSFCRKLQDASNANMEATGGNSELHCRFFEKPYTNTCLTQGSIHLTRVLELEIRNRTAVLNSIFVGWRNIEMFAVPSKDRPLRYVTVSFFWQNIVTPRLLCVPLLPKLAYSFSAFGGSEPPFGHLVVETATPQFTIMSFAGFIQTAEYDVANLFMASCLWP